MGEIGTIEAIRDEKRPMPSIADTTELVLRLGRGEYAAADKLLPVVYDELRNLAEAYLRHERAGHTLQPTALVHEVFLKLVDVENIEWQGKAQFLALAARQIRKILIDHARRHRAAKRGAGARRVELQPDVAAPEIDVDLLALDDALAALADRSPRQSQVVELRYFGGMSVEEVAEVLGVSPRTVKGDWRAARAWLRQRME